MVQNRFKEAENCRELLKTTRILRINFCCVWFEYLIFSAASLSRLRPVNVLRDNRQFHVRTHRFLCSVPPHDHQPLVSSLSGSSLRKQGGRARKFSIDRGFHFHNYYYIAPQARKFWGSAPKKIWTPLGKHCFYVVLLLRLDRNLIWHASAVNLRLDPVGSDL